MKAIVIKINDKVELVEKVDELTPNEFVNYKKQQEERLLEHENDKKELFDRLEKCEKENAELKKEIEKLWYQFKVDHGESEE